jgi:hypothetical protein
MRGLRRLLPALRRSLPGNAELSTAGAPGTTDFRYRWQGSYILPILVEVAATPGGEIAG